MPLTLEDAASAAAGAAQGGFDLQTANTLFWKQVPLLLRQGDREDQNEELTFRILTGTMRGNHNMRVLRIHISSDSDHFFLHSLEVSEEEFQSLKNEQGILVDFASFPMKIITLLDKCTTTQPLDAPRFQAVLTVRGMESIFRIVETNDFKQLPHITLTFRPGNDAAIKQFLAFRLLEVKGDVDELTTKLQQAQARQTATDSDLSSVRQQLSSLQDQYDKHLREVQADAKTQKAISLEERARERAEVKDAHEKELSELTRKHQEAVSQLSARLAELDSDNRKLRDNKYELDTRVSELSHRLGSAEGANRSLEDEVSRLRAMCGALSSDKSDREVTINDIRAKLLAAEEKAASQQEVIESQKSRIKDLETGVRSAEARCGELKDSLTAESTRVRDLQQEVVKGNAAIDKLASDLRLCKEKVKRKQAILVRQEEELSARDAQIAQQAKDTQAAAAQTDTLKQEVASLRQENSELRGKIDDSRQQLQVNEQMIRWLNQQVTEAQLGSAAGTGFPGSRYTAPSYRPALPPPTAPSSATAATAATTPAHAALMPAPPPSAPASATSAHATAVVTITSAGGLSAASKYTPAGAGAGGAQMYGSAQTATKTYLSQPLASPVRAGGAGAMAGAMAGAGSGPTPYQSGYLSRTSSGGGAAGMMGQTQAAQGVAGANATQGMGAGVGGVARPVYVTPAPYQVPAAPATAASAAQPAASRFFAR